MEDIQPFVARCSICIAPLRIGGAEGLPVQAGDVILLADTRGDFAEVWFLCGVILKGDSEWARPREFWYKRNTAGPAVHTVLGSTLVGRYNILRRNVA